MVCPDLRGYGRSTVPPDEPRHAQASKRAMGADVAAVMGALGHEAFAVVGHDRGSLVAFRTAMDHPDRVAALTTIGRGCPSARPSRGWADDLCGTGIDSGHHVAEEAPVATAAALAGFWADVGWA